MTHTLLATAVAFVMAACATTPTGDRPEAAVPPPTLPVIDPSAPMMQVSLPIDDGSVDGIVVLSWAIDDNGSVIDAFFTAHPPADIAATSVAAMRRNGLALATTTLVELPKVLRALGGTSITVSSWLGQATQQTQIAARNLDHSTACVIDGGSRRLDAGSLQLLLRGWTVPLEVGAVTDIEVVPVHTPGGSIPGARRTASESFPSAGFFAAMARGSVLLITSATPRQSSASTRGPTAGPPVSLPPTLGEMLLGRPTDQSLASARRPMLVVIPLISGAHFAAANPIDSSTPSP